LSTFILFNLTRTQSLFILVILAIAKVVIKNHNAWFETKPYTTLFQAVFPTFFYPSITCLGGLSSDDKNDIDASELCLVNTMPCCKGIYTRILNNQRSTIDYILLSDNLSRQVKSAAIDDKGSLDLNSYSF
jgi:hypothetical protein